MSQCVAKTLLGYQHKLRYNANYFMVGTYQYYLPTTGNCEIRNVVHP